MKIRRCLDCKIKLRLRRDWLQHAGWHGHRLYCTYILKRPLTIYYLNVKPISSQTQE